MKLFALLPKRLIHFACNSPPRLCFSLSKFFPPKNLPLLATARLPDHARLDHLTVLSEPFIETQTFLFSLRLLR